MRCLTKIHPSSWSLISKAALAKPLSAQIYRLIQAAAGRAIAYQKDKAVRGWFDELGKELMRRLGLGPLGAFVHESETTARPAPHLSGLFPHEEDLHCSIAFWPSAKTKAFLPKRLA